MDLTFEISDRTIGAVPVAAVTGEIDVATAPALRERLQQLVGESAPTVVVDLSGVSFLDSTALGVLVGAHKRCREAGGQLRLVITEPRILKVFEITGLTEIFPIYETADEAAR